MAKSFSDQEKEHIRRHLTEACSQSWAKYGYKKTSVDDLCRQAGISKGAFYLFFESKEALFCEVLCNLQSRIYHMALEVMEEQKDRYGAAEALKRIYREYDKHPFLYDGHSLGFTALKNKLSTQQLKRFEEADEKNRGLFLDRPYLRLKVGEEMAGSVIYSLIMNIRNKELLPHHMETFDFMAEHLIEELYE